MFSLPSRTTTAGLVLGTVAALTVTSETVRRSNTYWWLADHLVTPTLRKWLDPETAHQASIWALKFRMQPMAPVHILHNPMLKVKVWDLDFASPIGMAAGFDKQAACVDQVLDMGFAFIEVGGVTPKPQPGNAKPRMWRLVADKAVINRFGFNSDGHDVVASRLALHDHSKGVLGVNLAKNTDSTSTMIDDYVAGVDKLGPLVDFIVVNVSCPNVGWTKNLGRDGKDEVKDLLLAVKAKRDGMKMKIPMLMKLGPDMNEKEILKMVTLAVECGVDGLVVSNTTSSRPPSLKDTEDVSKNPGGLSGQPLKPLALATLRHIYSITRGAIPIIGVGGISSGQDVYERIRAGATLVQVYTALVYEGPGLVVKMMMELEELMKRDGFHTIEEVVGVDCK